MSIYGAYLEDYHFIKLIIPKDISFTNIILSGNKEEVPLSIFKEEIYGNERHLYTSFQGYIVLHLDYDIIVNNKHQKCLKYPLLLGKITRTKRFDIENYTNVPLGVLYTKEYSIFRVWSPVAKELILVIDGDKYNLSYTEKGVWELTLEKDTELCKYYYLVRINKEFVKSLDPYGSCHSLNFEENIVLDLSKTYHQTFDYVSCDDPIIEEISIRDLTSKKGGGTFKDAVMSKDENFGIGYLKNLGINYIQLMPIFGFGGVCERTKKDYNWGYNPVAYNSISNYLTKDSSDPYAGINELKELIDIIHSYNIGVNMDVVFNHVYDSKTFSLGVLVPGYAYHTNQEGFMTNSSGCGNDLNTTKLMIRRFIIDSLTYYQKTFKIDGFRFDLMDLIDVDTLNLAYDALKQINDNVMVYGEGWNIPMVMQKDLGGLAENFWELPNYSFFNDYFRNAMKSNFDCSEGGFCLGKKYPHEFLYSAFTGFCVKEERWSSPKFSVNYVECHDNYTFYDTLKKILPDASNAELIDRMILSLGCVILSQGIPFLHLGEEFGRSKNFCHNSYNLSDEINGVDWDQISEFTEVVDSLKELIKLRKKYSFFRFKTKDEIKKYIHLDNFNNLLQLRYYDLNNDEYMMIVKNDYQEESKYFAPGTYLIFDSRKIVDNEIVESMILNKPGIYLFKK